MASLISFCLLLLATTPEKADQFIHWHAGGLEYDGQQEISPLDEQAVRQAAQRALAAGARAVVVCGVFSPLTERQEEWAATLVM